MKTFKYLGPFDAVDVAGQTVERDATASFDAATAEGLEGQASWEHVPDPERSKAAKKAAATKVDDSNDSQEG